VFQRKRVKPGSWWEDLVECVTQ